MITAVTQPPPFRTWERTKPQRPVRPGAASFVATIAVTVAAAFGAWQTTAHDSPPSAPLPAERTEISRPPVQPMFASPESAVFALETQALGVASARWVDVPLFASMESAMYADAAIVAAIMQR